MTSVSFVIPVYNKSLYLKYVVRSLEGQKGEFEKEFIFVDDGSSDDSYKKLLSLTKNLNNSVVIKQENKGSAHATNVGINLAKMKYIKFLDADDVILSNATSCLLKLLEKDDNLILAYGLQRKVARLEEVDLEENFNFQNCTKLLNPIKMAMRNSMFNPSQCLVRAESCKKVGGCDERIKFSQEYSLTLKLSRLGSFIRLNHPIAILPFKAPGQISEKKVNQLYRVSKSLELFVEDYPDLDIGLKTFAQRRLTARSWRFARRFQKASIFSQWFKLYLKGLFRLKNDILENCKKANKIYEDYFD